MWISPLHLPPTLSWCITSAGLMTIPVVRVTLDLCRSVIHVCDTYNRAVLLVTVPVLLEYTIHNTVVPVRGVDYWQSAQNVVYGVESAENTVGANGL